MLRYSVLIKFLMKGYFWFFRNLQNGFLSKFLIVILCSENFTWTIFQNVTNTKSAIHLPVLSNIQCAKMLLAGWSQLKKLPWADFAFSIYGKNVLSLIVGLMRLTTTRLKPSVSYIPIWLGSQDKPCEALISSPRHASRQTN